MYNCGLLRKHLPIFCENDLPTLKAIEHLFQRSTSLQVFQARQAQLCTALLTSRSQQYEEELNVLVNEQVEHVHKALPPFLVSRGTIWQV